MSFADQQLARMVTNRAAPRWVPVGGALAVCAGVLVLARPALAGWIVFGVLALTAGVLEPLAPLLLLPFAVAFGSLVSLDAHGIHVGPTDVLVLALVLGVLAPRPAPPWGASADRPYSPGDWALSTLKGRRAQRAPGLDKPDSPVSTSHSRQRKVLASAATAVRRLWHEKRLAAWVFVALVAYLTVVCLSLVVATSRAGTLKEIVKWSEVLAVTAATLWLARRSGRLRLIAWAMIGAGVAQALLGYAQWVVATGDLGPGGASIRVFGTFAQPNPFAGYLNLSLPLALALVVFGDDARERWVAGAASVLLLGAQALADSRGGLLGLSAAVVTLAVVGWHRERLAGWTLLIGVPAAIVAWVTHIIPVRIEDAVLRQFRVNDVLHSGQVTPANYSTAERLAHWVAGLRMFAAHPILGVGAGNYNAAYARFAAADWPEPLGHAHNYYINVAAETGALGLLTFLAFTVVTLYLGWCVAHTAVLARAPARALALGLFAVLVALTIHNLTDDLFVHAIELQVALCIGCLLALKVQKLPTG
ncbi:MAG TPA: O-antigen ligase family protein [Ktedonobacterales bacterium]|nr:O-antigen ligase family protein [Ktedonobacterales bacterium]